MKLLAMCFFVIINSTAFSSEDHGTAIKLNPKHGGKVAIVVLDEDHYQMAKDQKNEQKGVVKHHSKPLYISELVVLKDNKVEVYIYDTSMKELSLKEFPGKLKVNVRDYSTSRGKDFIVTKGVDRYSGTFALDEKLVRVVVIDFFHNTTPLHTSFNFMNKDGKLTP